MLKLKEWLEKPSFGIVTLLLFALMEGIGLYTQHILGYSPCSNCVLVRAYLGLIAFSGIISLSAALINFSNKFVRLLIVTSSYLVGVTGTWFALVHSYDNYLIEEGKRMAGCDYGSPFPEWMPLDTWLPSVFKIEGLCGMKSELFSWLTFTELSMIGLPIVLIASTFLFLNYVFVFLKNK